MDRKILNRYLDYAYRQKEYKLYRKSVKKNIFRYNLLQEYIWNGKGDKVNSLRDKLRKYNNILYILTFTIQIIQLRKKLEKK